MSEAQADDGPKTSVRVLASGGGWCASEILCRSGPGDMPFEERHDWVSVATVLEGVFTYHSGRGRSLLTPGSILLGNLNACFCCSHEHGTGDRCVAFHFDPAVFEEIASGLRGVPGIAFNRQRVPPLEALVSIFADIRALTEVPDSLAAEQLAFRVGSAALQLSGDGEEGPISLSDEARAARLATFIDACFAESLSLRHLAAEAGLSRFHFLRVFRRVMGVTPYHYLLGRRMNAAAERLRSSDETVTEIAYACGFSDLSEFSRRFRRRFGMSASAYRSL